MLSVPAKLCEMEQQEALKNICQCRNEGCHVDDQAYQQYCHGNFIMEFICTVARLHNKETRIFGIKDVRNNANLQLMHAQTPASTETMNLVPDVELHGIKCAEVHCCRLKTDETGKPTCTRIGCVGSR